MVPSDAHRKYTKTTAPIYGALSHEFRKATREAQKPLRVEFRFVRGSKHKFDYTNALDTIQDLMVEHKWITDDNADEIIPIIDPYIYDKNEPGVFISIPTPAT